MRLVAPAHAQPSLLLRTGGSRGLFSSPPPGAFASLSVRDGGEALKLDEKERPVAAVAEGSGKKGKLPPMEQLLRYPLAMLALVPNSVALFAAGAGAGAVAKTLTAPLDRVKLLMQTHSVQVVGESTKRGVGFLEGAWCRGGRIHLEEA